MSGFKFLEEFPRWPGLSFPRIIGALSDAFLYIGARSNIEQAPIGFGVRYDGRCVLRSEDLDTARKHFYSSNYGPESSRAPDY